MKLLTIPESLDVLSHVPLEMAAMLPFPKASRERIERHQWRQVQRLLRHAYDNVPFYRRKYDDAGLPPEKIRTREDFQKLPTVTKKELIENFPDGVLTRGSNLDDCIVSTTSGSSGQTLSVVFDNRALARYMVAGLRTYMFGLAWRPWYSQVSVYTSPHPLQRVLGLFWLRFVGTLKGVEYIAGELQRRAPDFFCIYPSVLKELKNYLEGRGERLPPLKAIFTNSEMSRQEERNELGRFFGCPVFDEYSSEELHRIATQCRSYQYHVMEDLNYLEILDDAGRPLPLGEKGHIVGTNLVNFKMPFIRYRQGDLAALEKPGCACGRNFMIMKDLLGRVNDEFVFANGKVLSSGFLLDLAYSILLDFPGAVADFCVVQRKIDEIDFEILPGAAFGDDARTKIAGRLHEHVPSDVRIEVKTVKSLEKATSGKRNPIISYVSRSRPRP